MQFARQRGISEGLQDSLLLRGQLPMLEALLLCAQHGWMSLVVGRSGAGDSQAPTANPNLGFDHEP